MLLNGDGSAKVTDFGIARSLDVQQGMTQTGTVLGTSDYIAPEQAQGRHVDEHTDVYSLGVVLYELLTGEVPFAGENFVAVAMRHINEPPPPVRDKRPDVSPRVEAAVQTAMAKEPGRPLPDDGDVLPGARGVPRRAESAVRTQVDRAGAPAGRRAGGTERRLAVAPARRARRRCSRSARWSPRSSGTAARACSRCTAPRGRGAARCARAALGGDGVRPVRLPDRRGARRRRALRDRRRRRAHTGRPRTTARPAPRSASPASASSSTAGARCSCTGSAIATSTPGFTAVIRAGDSPERSRSTVSVVADRRAAGRTFTITGGEHRYYVIWITSLGPGGSTARINEVQRSLNGSQRHAADGLAPAVAARRARCNGKSSGSTRQPRPRAHRHER